MGSDLYAAVDVRHPNTANLDPRHFSSFIKRTWCLGRHIIVDAFGSTLDEPWSMYHEVNGHTEKRSVEDLHALGYLTSEEIRGAQELEDDCPWWKDEPYWVRKLAGPEFVAIVREKRWQKLQDGDFSNLECCAELRALAACVESLLSDGMDARVWVWHSQ
jgi:hypothetical protein